MRLITDVGVELAEEGGEVGVLEAAREEPRREGVRVPHHQAVPRRAPRAAPPRCPSPGPPPARTSSPATAKL